MNFKHRMQAKCGAMNMTDSNKHKKPFFFTSELNNYVHNRNGEDKLIVHMLWNDYFRAFYKFKRRKWK